MSSFEKCVRNKAGILTLRLLLLCAEFIIFRVSIISIQWFDLIVSFSCSSHAPHTSTGGRCCVSFLFGQFQRGKKNIYYKKHVMLKSVTCILMRLTLSFFVILYSIQCTFYLMNWNCICELCLCLLHQISNVVSHQTERTRRLWWILNNELYWTALWFAIALSKVY